MMLQSSTIRQRKAPPPGIYDPAGNILSKTVAGRTTTYTYDKANQLVSSKNADGKVTRYEYDAAGRMVKEGEKTFAYGWLDKVMQVAENGKTTQSYSYDISGQLATADYGDSKETFLWDGLALLSRNNLKYVNEPAVTGGNPILAGDKMLFDDMLGNTLGVKDGEKFSAIDRDAFGELKPGEKPNLAVNFFTGKPEIDGLGYSFLFRNYRADLGKWQTTDPLGYPDGWNNLAYCNNDVISSIDWLGACRWKEVWVPGGGVGAGSTGHMEKVWVHEGPGLSEVVDRKYSDWVEITGSDTVTMTCGQNGTGALAPVSATIDWSVSYTYAGVSLNASYKGTSVSTAITGITPPTCSDPSRPHSRTGFEEHASRYRLVTKIIKTTYSCGGYEYSTSTNVSWSSTVVDKKSCVYE